MRFMRISVFSYKASGVAFLPVKMATRGASHEQTTEREDIESVIAGSFLNLEKLDTDFFRSRTLWQPRGGRAVYGGQVVGQALAAASYSVQQDHHAHSLHCYFLRPGNVKIPILYNVERTREGKVYCSRNIKAMQEGQAIFTMQASFKTPETDSFQHQFTMPNVPPPEECVDVNEILAKAVGNDKALEYRKKVSHRITEEEFAILRRSVHKNMYYSSKPQPAKRMFWLKTAGCLGDDHKMHQCCAAYMSDSFMIGTALMPYFGGSRNTRGKFFSTSVDHALWFHSEFRADEWMLFETESPVCGEGRAYITGRMWTQDGQLAISVAQEAVVRTRIPKEEGASSAKSKL